jgi:hypothetical protein
MTDDSKPFTSILVIPSLNRYQPVTLTQLANMTSRRAPRATTIDSFLPRAKLRSAR